MDFLDPHKSKLRNIQLFTGYILVGILILLATTILLYQAYGFGLDKNGNIIQNGLVFVSSAPSSANIYINGTQKATTNARVILPAGQYILQIKKTGYKTWQRAFNLQGGTVSHFDYPLLVPQKLITKNLASYPSAPALSLQSPDRSWLLVTQPSSTLSFDEYNLNKIKTPPLTDTIPASVVDPSLGSNPTVQLVQWSTDNQYIILKLSSGTNDEFVLFDRQTPSDSVDLSSTFNVNPTTIEFINNVYNQFYIYDFTQQTLSTASLVSTTPKVILNDVLAFKSYGSSLILYVTADKSPVGDATIKLLDGTTNYTIQNTPLSPQYLLEFAKYSGNWYFIVGSSNDGKLYIYENPEQDLQSQPSLPLVPIEILHINQPNYVAFSTDTRFIMAENGNNFAVFDNELDKAYSYTLPVPLDAPQTHATWMDGARITFVGNGKVVMVDYDSANLQSLEPAVQDQIPFFDRNYTFIYVIAPNTAPNQTPASSTDYLTTTSLLINPPQNSQ